MWALQEVSGMGEVRLMGDWDQVWLGTVREWLVEIGMSHQNVVEYPKRTQLGCPPGMYEVCIICYMYCTIFDHAAGLCVYRHIHSTKITCMRIITPMVSLDAFMVTFGLHFRYFNGKIVVFKFNVFLTLQDYLESCSVIAIFDQAIGPHEDCQQNQSHNEKKGHHAQCKHCSQPAVWFLEDLCGSECQIL